MKERRIVVFGNSGSGKSTLAQRLSTSRSIAHLDLDDIAWKAEGIREDLGKSIGQLSDFMSNNAGWVIEGCYGSLISEAVLQADVIYFLNPGIAACQDNCKARPWEPHKYQSKEEQDKNLAMLLEWVAEYETRKDDYSYAAHKEIFDAYEGEKRELRSNADTKSVGVKR